MKTLTITLLSAGYNSQPVITDITLTVNAKETLVLMGTSGSGKTTLLLAILGILTPQKGTITLGDRVLDGVPIEERNIGYLPQDYGLFTHLDVIDNVTYGLRIRNIPRDAQLRKAAEILALVDLKGFDRRKIAELSGGEQQRVGLARALAIDPDLLLLDEPLSNIDQITKFDVALNLKTLFTKLNIPVILVTHNHEDALFLAEQLAVMIDGKITQKGRLKDILDAPATPLIKRLLAPFDVK